MTYKKKLTPSERKWHFVYVDEKHRNMFSSHGSGFNLIVRSERVKATIDSEWRIWAALLWDRLPTLREGSIIIMSKNRDGGFTVEVEK